MTMSFDDGVTWLRSGFYSENLMIRITSKALIDEAAASCGVSQWPLICANSNILSIAQRDFTGADGVKFYGVISRVTGVGERFTKTLTGQPISGSGSLHLVFDDSPKMLEAADQDWSASVIEIRTGEFGTEWSDALELFTGSVASASTLNVKGGISFRLIGNDYLLDEMVDFHQHDQWNRNHTWRGAATVGYVNKHPVTAEKQANGTEATYYYLTCLWNGNSPSSYIWEGAKRTDSDNLAVYNYFSEGCLWYYIVDIAGVQVGNADYLPDFKVWAAGRGKGTETTFNDKSGEILREIIAIGITRPDGNGSTDPINPALDDVTLDTTYFDDYDTDYNYQTGMIVDMLNVTHGSDWQVVGDDASWRDVFNRLVGDTGGLWYFTRDNKLRIQSLLDTPTDTEILILRRSDYETVDYRLVETVDGVLLNHTNNYPEWYGAPTVYGDGQGNGFVIEGKTALSNITDQAALGARFLARHGERDATFKNCLLAKVVNIGDIIKVTDPDDDFLAAGRKGLVIGVDRGTSPKMEVRL